MFLCDEAVPLIKLQVPNTNPIPAAPAYYGHVCNVSGASMKRADW